MSKNKYKPVREKMLESLVPLLEKSNLAEWLESRLHLSLTMMADDMFGNGNVTRDERKVLSGAIGVALDGYHTFLVENAPQLFDRRPWDEVSNGLVTDERMNGSEAEGRVQSAEEVEFVESGQQGMFVPLIEKAVRSNGTIPIKIIEPGWGSSGYYPAEVLERDAKIYQKGVKMFWNHQTPQEEAARPEGDLNNLAAELVSDGRYQANGLKGAGIYADAKVFEAYRKAVDDLAGHIGLSHRALGKAVHGVAEGREGPIITELTKARSVDFVTAPGAGGQIVSLFEAARPSPLTPLPRGEEKAADKKTTTVSVDNNSVSAKEAHMDELQLKQLQESVTTLQTTVGTVTGENAQLREALALRDAKDMVRQSLHGLDIPEVTRARLIESLPKSAPLKDGALDEEAFKSMIEKSIKAEVEYLTKAAGLGKIRGLGESSNEDEELDEAKVQAELEGAFAAIGLSEAGAKIAAKGHG